MPFSDDEGNRPKGFIIGSTFRNDSAASLGIFDFWRGFFSKSRVERRHNDVTVDANPLPNGLIDTSFERSVGI